jgi:cbb3-type cytochrome oxidase cytochrome c subunit
MDKETNTNTIIFTILLILSISCLIIIIDEYNKEEIKPIEEIEPAENLTYSGKNLTYSYYNKTTGEVIKKDSGIPIYNKVFKD